MITATFIGQDEQLRNYVRTVDFLDFLKECMSMRPKGEKYRFMSNITKTRCGRKEGGR